MHWWNYFFKSVRNIACEDYRCIRVKKGKKEKSDACKKGEKTLERYFDDAWEIDALRTLRFVFYLRDCRKGKGEKKLFRALVRHMRESGKIDHLKVNLQLIPEYGSWKDIPLCFLGTKLESLSIILMVDQLKRDKNTEHPSLCAKYVPSEGGAMDRKHKVAKKIAEQLNVSLTGYRKEYLVPLRKKLQIVEREMCANEWDNINYEHVPSIASMKYQKAFRTHDEHRYQQYLNDVKTGKKKLNTSPTSKTTKVTFINFAILIILLKCL